MVNLDGIVLAGGSGSRFSADSSALPKQFQIVGNAPVLIHALKGLLSMQCLRQVVVAVPQVHAEATRTLIQTYLPDSPVPVRLVVGGERRQDSSRLAIESLAADAPDRILIHDACRAFLPADFLNRVRERLLDRSYGAWIPVVPVVETLKRVENDLVVETVDRSRVFRVQTPQIFEYTVMRSLVEQARDLPEATFTDDASLCEYYGIPVGTFEGDVRNLKLTYQFELETLRGFLKDGAALRKSAPCEPESDMTFTA